jgi:selenophosphate synthase
MSQTDFERIGHIDRWKIPLEEIEAELKRGRKPTEMVCLGCAAKIPLIETVYPVLEELKPHLESTSQIRFQPREDVYLFESDGKISVQRGIYSVKDLLEGRSDQIPAEIQSFRPNGIVLLISLKALPSRDAFKQALLSFFNAVKRANHPLVVGKGHSIQISRTDEETYLVADYIRSRKGDLWGVANNDTIATIDPNLRHSSWISVFVGLNNALNDLFVSGVYKNLTLYPSYDARTPGEEEEIRNSIQKYLNTFREMECKVIDRGGLGFRTNSNGATVIGTSEHEIPCNWNLRPGDILIASRPLGDLAPLTEYLIRETLEEDTAEFESLPLHSLQWMFIPNVDAAKIISQFLPMKGQPFDSQRHITTARDMTGPGILSVEELAEDSGVDIYIDSIRFFDERLASVEMENPTSGTNGSLIMACHPDLVKRIMEELRQAGYDPWVIGKAVEKSKEPTILLTEELRRYRFLSGYEKGIFSRYQFVPARRLAH